MIVGEISPRIAQTIYGTSLREERIFLCPSFLGVSWIVTFEKLVWLAIMRIQSALREQYVDMRLRKTV